MDCKTFLCMLSFFVLFSSSVFAIQNWCYQETTTQTFGTGGNLCGAINRSGSYRNELFTDGTNADGYGYHYETVTKPVFVGSNNRLYIKHGYSTYAAYNITIPDTCMNFYDNNNFTIRVYSGCMNARFFSVPQCFNGSWVNIGVLINGTTTCGGATGTSVEQYMNDTSYTSFAYPKRYSLGGAMYWSGATSGTGNNASIWDMGIWWNMTDTITSKVNYSFTSPIWDGIMFVTRDDTQTENALAYFSFIGCVVSANYFQWDVSSFNKDLPVSNVYVKINFTRTNAEWNNLDVITFTSMNNTPIISTIDPDAATMANLIRPILGAQTYNSLTGFNMYNLPYLANVSLRNIAVNNIKNKSINYFDLGMSITYGYSCDTDQRLFYNTIRNTNSPMNTTLVVETGCSILNVGDGSWNITGNCYLQNTNLSIEKNLYLSGNLTLNNSILNFMNRQQKIYQYKGSSLSITNKGKFGKFNWI